MGSLISPGPPTRFPFDRRGTEDLQMPLELPAVTAPRNWAFGAEVGLPGQPAETLRYKQKGLAVLVVLLVYLRGILGCALCRRCQVCT